MFTLSGLTEGERAVVEEAVNDTYYAEDTDDEAFRSVMETFRRHEAVQETEYEGLWLVRYVATSLGGGLAFEDDGRAVVLSLPRAD